MQRLRASKIYLRMLVIKRLFNIMGVEPIHIILPIILNFLITSLGSIFLVLFIPLVSGIVHGDFAFVNEIPILSNVIAILPKVKHFINIELSDNRSIFLSLINLIFLTAVLKNIIAYINSLLSNYWNGKFSQRIFFYIFSRFLSFGKLYFDRTNKGYIHLILGYSDTIRNLFNFLQRSAAVIISLAVNITIMCIISWRLTFFTFLIFPLLRLFLKSIMTGLRIIAGQTNSIRIELREQIDNILSCVPLIKAYNKESETEEKCRSLREQIRRLGFKSGKINNLILPIQRITTTGFFLLAVLIVVLFLAEKRPTNVFAFAIFFYIARRALPQFNIFNRIIYVFTRMEPRLKEILKNLDENNKFFVIEGKTVFRGLVKQIDFNHLSFYYTEGRPILENINFSVEKGKTTAIVGPTGAGKTTLVHLIMRFYECPPSSIIIDGVDIRDFTTKSLRASMALVSQEAWLFNDTLRNNITFGLDKKITDDQIIDIVRKLHLSDLIERLPKGLDTKIGDRGAKLSGGEKQRIAIARLLLKNSEILILDEATSSLDSKTEKLIQDVIEEAIKERTVIVIAHRFSTIRNADKIIVIENGRSVEEGTLGELIDKKGKFYEYWEAQKFS